MVNIKNPECRGSATSDITKRRYPQICKTNKNRFSNLYLV
ncbi:hypothetical protein RUMGNA_02206 [Mediterraneibacter gnavus ATCC 29149]|uniref:Uncharacterized protein n=1 Tax=Mediterraneibacter gnavus (strain ATCC 29149 / DSM 114966 / JCM 6515 / VPI C7-9) TaxID=411470 RepID=A7B3S6_MEDG7|nr:hypothetical protein RUMGNA_02206 [Mediterraneibacter gnavus ATCC 29149]